MGSLVKAVQRTRDAYQLAAGFGSELAYYGPVVIFREMEGQARL